MKIIIFNVRVFAFRLCSKDIPLLVVFFLFLVCSIHLSKAGHSKTNVVSKVFVVVTWAKHVHAYAPQCGAK